MRRRSAKSNVGQFLLAGGALVGILGALFWFRTRSERAVAPERGTLHPALMDKLGQPRFRSVEKTLAERCGVGSESCACVNAQARAALDLELNAVALAVMDGSPSCGKNGEWMGVRAEAYARTERLDEASALAEERLRADPDDPYALYALGYVAYQRGLDAVAALRLAEAGAKGRSVASGTLMTLLFFRANDLVSARRECQKILQQDPDQVEALYNLALIDQREDKYHAAREGYLRVLRIEPRHPDSRYNLALLTHSAGALGEARHNFKKLVELVGPVDSRSQALQVLLEGEAGRAPGSPSPP